MRFKPVIGLEIHVQLNTKTKAFCSCPADVFELEPNSAICPVCTGQPGALPVPSREMYEYGILLASALNCRINEYTRFDRKNYFYPDLPKGYQITQYFYPLANDGYLELDGEKIRINRIHLEEDAGKLVHSSETITEAESSLVDMNRCGVPLAEIVTEPDIKSPEQARKFLEKLRQILRYLGVSTGDMEKGALRCDANISVIDTETNRQSNKVEVKNMNSFKFVEKALEFEFERIKNAMLEGKDVEKETRGWDLSTKTTISMRSKEEANDYRYFPEPDIPPVVLSSDEIKKIVEKMPELPDQKKERFMKDYNLSEYEANISDVEQRYRDLEANLGVRVEKGQSVSERIIEMYLKPLGYTNMQEILDDIEYAKRNADERGRELAEQVKRGEFRLEQTDILKGVGSYYIANILQNGSVAKEFLGVSAGTDNTPLDTDIYYIQDKEGQKISEALTKYNARSFGDILFIVKNRGQWQDTTNFRDIQRSERNYDPTKLELFYTGVVSEAHYGIRTGFATTEIDVMVFTDQVDQKRRKNALIEIAKNGYYIPVVNEEGELLFTPEMYDEYRNFFNGVGEYEGGDFYFEEAEFGSRHESDVSSMQTELEANQERIERLNDTIQEKIKEIVESAGVEFRSNFDTGILGAQMYAIGSTDRKTADPKSNPDFDYTIRVDAEDARKVRKIIVPELTKFFGGVDNGSNTSNSLYQFRQKEIKAFGEDNLDIDIGFVLKSTPDVYSTDNAVKDRLEWIQTNISEDAYQKTLANIILTKRILKEGEAYKKLEHGGFGGVGVENWILAYNGNMVKAFESFLNAATEDGQTLLLEEFQKRYRIIDPGLNLQGNYHDNFIMRLKEDGYTNMIQVIRKYLRK